MTTAKLDDFIEEDSFLHDWIQLHKERTPELLKQQEPEVLWVGLLCIATNAIPITLLRQVKQCNMYIGLVGEPGTGKTTEMELVKRLCVQIPHGTPEAIAEWLQQNAGGVYCVDEIGAVIKNARRAGYMREWGYLLNSAYTGEDIILKRRKKDKEVYAPYGSYWFNCMFNGLEEDYAGIFNEYAALKRRLLPLKFSAEFPADVTVEDVVELDLMDSLKKRVDEMRENIHLCLIHPDIINSNINNNPLICDRTVDRRIRLLVRDYIVKAVICYLINTSYTDSEFCELIDAKSEEFEEVLDNFAYMQNEKESRIEIIYNSNKKNSLYTYPTLPTLCIKKMENLSLLLNKEERNLKVLYIKSNRLPTLSNTLKKVLATLSNTLQHFRLAESYDPEFEKQAERVLNYIQHKSVTARREVSMNLKIKAKDLEEIEKTLSIRNQLRLIKQDRGRVLYVDPSRQYCYNCKHFDLACKIDYPDRREREMIADLVDPVKDARECKYFELI